LLSSYIVLICTFRQNFNNATILQLSFTVESRTSLSIIYKDKLTATWELAFSVPTLQVAHGQYSIYASNMPERLLQ